MSAANPKLPLDTSKRGTQFPSMDAPVPPFSTNELNAAIARVSAFIAAHDKPTKTSTSKTPRKPAEQPLLPPPPLSSPQQQENSSDESLSVAPTITPLIGDYLSAPEIARILAYACLIFKKEPTLLKITFPLNAAMPATSSRRETGPRELIVVGDIHGSIRELMNIFDQHGPPPVSNYLFLGDYVDRGRESLAVVLYLFLLKIRWPNHVFMLRGNHESFLVTSVYGFRAECKLHFADESIFGLMNIVFMYLPLAAIVHNCAFCCHGGVSQWMKSREVISAITRPALFERLSLHEHLIATDIMWADPRRVCEFPFSPSLVRGCGYCFNREGLEKILRNLRCSLLIRGHESKKNGVEAVFDGLCITVHSTVIANMETAGVLRLGVTEDGSKLLTEPILQNRSRTPKLNFIVDRLAFYYDLYRKSFSKRSIKPQADLRVILEKIDDARFFRRNVAGQDELYLWVQSHVGRLFDEFVRRTNCRRPKAFALQMFPALLSVSFGNIPENCDRFGPEMAKLLVKYAKHCREQRAKGLLSDEDVDCLVIADDLQENTNQGPTQSALANYRMMKEKESIEERDTASAGGNTASKSSSTSNISPKSKKDSLAVEPASLPPLTEEDIGRGEVRRRKRSGSSRPRKVVQTSTERSVDRFTERTAKEKSEKKPASRPKEPRTIASNKTKRLKSKKGSHPPDAQTSSSWSAKH